MPFNPNTHHRQSIRLHGFDYATPGAYFVTIVTQGRECVFGDVVDGVMVLNERGQAVDMEWNNTAVIRTNVELDTYQIMPNHIHGIVWIVDRCRGAARCAPTARTFHDNVAPGSLSAIVRAFKSAATKSINVHRNMPGTPVWQRNYHERIIRNDHELNRIRQYIMDNPKNWEMDDHHPRRRALLV